MTRASTEGLHLCDVCLENPAEVARAELSLCRVCATAAASLPASTASMLWASDLRDLVDRARRLAVSAGPACDTLHLLAALVSAPSGIQALEAAGMPEERMASLWAQVSELAGLDPLAEVEVGRADAFTEPARRALLEARELALEEGMPEVMPRHLLDVLRRDGATARLLVRSGLEDSEAPAEPAKALAAYARNLSEAARRGELNPLIGRRAELSEVVEALVRKTKNNPVLVGEPGVGKTAVAEGLAQFLLGDEAPSKLRGYEVYALDLAALVAGTRYRGDFEGRLREVIAESSDPQIKVVLFLDELDSLVGVGASAGSLDAVSLLKPPLARGELKLVGATTFDGYKRLSKDAALERRLQPVFVDEPSAADTLAILTALAPAYAAHHRLEIASEALEACVELSGRYLHERRWPDKAIDVLDAACARLALRDTPQRRLEDVEDALAALYRESERRSVDGYRGVCDVRARIAELERRRDALLREGRADAAREDRAAVETLAQADVAPVVARLAGVGEEAVSAGGRRARLERLARLGERLLGQDEAVKAVARTLRRVEAGVNDPRRPLASFLFLGPTGVGKSELARRLAFVLFGDEECLIRVDMGEYGEKHTVSRLLGSPPGYVGHEGGGQLTEAVRRKPYSVVLLDEVEKAHPEVLNAFLAVLEDGFATDGLGRRVSFRNTVVVMTSNAGSTSARRSLGFGADLALKREAAVKEAFLPELLNRIDEVVYFDALAADDVRAVCRLQVDALAERLEPRFVLALSEAALDKLAEEGFSDEYGARYLRRHLQRTLEVAVSDAVLEVLELAAADAAAAADEAAGGTLVVDLSPADPSSLSVALETEPLKKPQKRQKPKQPKKLKRLKRSPSSQPAASAS